MKYMRTLAACWRIICKVVTMKYPNFVIRKKRLHGSQLLNNLPTIVLVKKSLIIWFFTRSSVIRPLHWDIHYWFSFSFFNNNFLQKLFNTCTHDPYACFHLRSCSNLGYYYQLIFLWDRLSFIFDALLAFT